jgi:DNA-binding transcriptional MerR regulator
MTSRPVINFPASAQVAGQPAAPTASRTPLETGLALQVCPGAFKPLSREDVAGVLGISIRTLENWVKQGRLPAPTSIAGRRYWHPERFYATLDAMLQSGSDNGPLSSAVAPAAAKAPNVPLSTAGQKAKQSSQDAAEAMLREAAAKAEAAA